MFKKALVTLYFVEALLLLVPWNLIFHGRMSIAYNEGVVMWLGVPGFYAVARLMVRYGPTLWVRLGGVTWTVMWAVSSNVLSYRVSIARPELLLAVLLVLVNTPTLLLPLGRAPIHGGTPTDQRTRCGPTSILLGSLSWLAPVAFFGFMLQYGPWRWMNVTEASIAILLLSIAAAAPVFSLTGILVGIGELRLVRAWQSIAGTVMSAASFVGLLVVARVFFSF